MKRVLAVVVLVFAILASLLIGCWKASVDMNNNLKDAFRSGVNSDGYGIQSDIDIICSNASAIISVSQRCGVADDSLISSAKSAYENMKLAESVSEKRKCLDILTDSIYDLYGEIKNNVKLSDADLRLVKQCEGEIQSRLITIESNGYNDEVAKYNRKLSSFPANIISQLLGIKEAEMF